jgi:hypothetical protein
MTCFIRANASGTITFRSRRGGMERLDSHANAGFAPQQRRSRRADFGDEISLSLHSDCEGLVFRAPGMHHERLYACACALVAREVRDVARYDVGFTEFNTCRSSSFDLDDHSAVEGIERFLSARMHVPGRRDARPEFY